MEQKKLNDLIYAISLNYLTGQNMQFPALDFNTEMQLIDKLHSHRILYILSDFLYSKLSKPACRKLKILEILNRKITTKKISVLQEIKNVADKNDITFLLIKGLALSKYIYKDIYKRPGSDIDIWVKSSQTLQFVKNLLKEGYYINSLPNPKTGEVKKLYKPVMLFGANYFEYELNKDIQGIDIGIEIKKCSSALRHQQNNPFIKKFTNYDNSIELEDIKINTSDLEYTLLHLCANVYGNTESHFGVLYCYRLVDFFDIYLFIKKYRNAINWQKVVKHARILNLTYRIYKIFNDVNQLFGLDNNIIKLFSFNKNDYTEEVFPSGSLTDWTIDIKKRVFDRKSRIIDYYAFKKSSLFDPDEISKKGYKVNCFETVDKQPKLSITDKDKKAYAQASFYKDTENLYLKIKPLYKMKKNRSKYQIFLTLYNNDLTSDVYQTLIRTYYDKDGIYAVLEDYKHKTYKTVSVSENDDTVLLNIPLGELTGIQEKIFAFNISISKKVDFNTYKTRASLYTKVCYLIF